MANTREHETQMGERVVLTNNLETVAREEQHHCLAVSKPPIGGLREHPGLNGDEGARFPTHLIVPPGGGRTALREVLEWMGAAYAGERDGQLRFLVPRGRYDVGRWFIGKEGSVIRELAQHTDVARHIEVQQVSLEEFLKASERHAPLEEMLEALRAKRA